MGKYITKLYFDNYLVGSAGSESSYPTIVPISSSCRSLRILDNQVSNVMKQWLLSNATKVAKIKFIVDGVTYKCTENFNWLKWVKSYQDTSQDKFKIQKNCVFYENKLLKYNNSNVNRNDQPRATTYSLQDNFSFTIDNTTCYAEDGMTFADWVSSVYNNLGYTISDNVITYSTTTKTSTILDVAPTDTILENHTYNVDLIYKMSLTVINGTITNDDREIRPSETNTYIIVPSENCLLPESVSVSNASFTYDNSTGELVISNPTGKVSCSIKCTRTATTIQLKQYLSAKADHHTKLYLYYSIDGGSTWKTLVSLVGTGLYGSTSGGVNKTTTATITHNGHTVKFKGTLATSNYGYIKVGISMGSTTYYSNSRGAPETTTTSNEIDLSSRETIYADCKVVGT